MMVTRLTLLPGKLEHAGKEVSTNPNGRVC